MRSPQREADDHGQEGDEVRVEDRAQDDAVDPQGPCQPLASTLNRESVVGQSGHDERRHRHVRARNSGVVHHAALPRKGDEDQGLPPSRQAVQSEEDDRGHEKRKRCQDARQAKGEHIGAEDRSEGVVEEEVDARLSPVDSVAARGRPDRVEGIRESHSGDSELEELIDPERRLDPGEQHGDGQRQDDKSDVGGSGPPATACISHG